MFVEVADPQVIDDLARAQLLWHHSPSWPEKFPACPFESNGETDLPSRYMDRWDWKFYILTEE